MKLYQTNLKMQATQFWEMIRFASIGVFAVATDFVIYFLLVFLNLPISLSKSLSYICGNIISFVGNRTFVFNATKKHLFYQILPFALLYGSTLIINNVVNQWLLNIYGIKLLAWFIATGVAVSINFLGVKFIVFKKS